MAASNRLVKEIHDQFLVCKICYEVYAHPKTLTCLHSYCLGCLQKHVDSTRNRALRVYSRFVTCPICRGKTEIPTGGLRKLPDNFLLSNLTDVLHKKAVRSSMNCDICPTLKSRSNKASSKCIECAKVLCVSCVELHQTTNVTKNHSLLDIKGEGDIQCKVHVDEVVRFYCEPCEACVCVVCTFTEHKNHEVSAFNDVMSKHKLGLVMSLESCTGRLGELINTIQALASYEKSIADAKELIRDCAINHIRFIRQNEKKLIKQLEDMLVTEEVADLIKNKDWLANSFDTIKSTCDITQILTKDGNVAMLLLKDELKTRLADIMKIKFPTVPEVLKRRAKFTAGNVELGFLEICGIRESPVDTNHIVCTDIKNRHVCRSTGNSYNDQSITTSHVPHTQYECRSTRVQTDRVVLFDSQVQVGVEQEDVSTNTIQPDYYNRGSQIMPDTTTKFTTARPRFFDAETSTLELSSVHPFLSSKIVLTSQPHNDPVLKDMKPTRISHKAMQTVDADKPMLCNLYTQTDQLTEYTTYKSNDSTKKPSLLCNTNVDSAFSANNIKSFNVSYNFVHQETMTNNPLLSDTGTMTTVVLFTDAGSFTDPTFTRNIGTETAFVQTSDQCTNTDTIHQKDAETDFVIETVEQDTSTERRIFLHAEVGTDCRQLSDSFTCMDTMTMSCSPIMTYNQCLFDGLSGSRTSQMQDTSMSKTTNLSSLNDDDSIYHEQSELTPGCGQCDNTISCTDKATSTESLVYMGLAGEFDKLDQIFPRWNYACDEVSLAVSGSELSYDTDHVTGHVVTIDQAIGTADMFVSDTATQTQLTYVIQSPRSDSDPTDTYRLYDSPDYTTKTSPRSVRASWHSNDSVFVSNATLSISDSVDRWTNTARYSWRAGTPPSVTMDKATSTEKVQLIDKVTMTTCVGVKDERMAECITKLKHVKDTLSRFDPESCESKKEKRYSAELTMDERKKVLDDMLRETYSVNVSNDRKTESGLSSGLRRQQPITTFKSKIQETSKKRNSVPNQTTTRDSNVGVKMGRSAVVNIRLLRNNSAPDRMDDDPTTMSLYDTELGQTNISLPAITEITTSTKSDNTFVESTDSLSSADAAVGTKTKSSQSAKQKTKSSSFVHRFLSRKQATDKKLTNVPTLKFNKDMNKSVPDIEKAPKSNKKPSSFVYVRQRLFAVHHDSSEENANECDSSVDGVTKV